MLHSVKSKIDFLLSTIFGLDTPITATMSCTRKITFHQIIYRSKTNPGSKSVIQNGDVSHYGKIMTRKRRTIYQRFINYIYFVTKIVEEKFIYSFLSWTFIHT